MPKDFANIYKLKASEFKNVTKRLWSDSVPGTEDIAKRLLKEINALELPFTLGIEADYGMGKTFFFTRFCEYLKNNDMEAIYISAWEKDYCVSPFIYISAEILKFFDNKNIKSKLKNKCKKVICNLAYNTNVELNLCEEVKTSTNIGKLLDSFIRSDDDIADFKNILSKKIETLKNKKLFT